MDNLKLIGLHRLNSKQELGALNGHEAFSEKEN